MIYTIHFEDNGQDFLQWDVEVLEGLPTVVDSRPFQSNTWKGTIILNWSNLLRPKTLKDEYVMIKVDQPLSEMIKHRVITIEQKETTCPECMQPTDQDELDTFGGFCEECAGVFNQQTNP